eukprot:SAG31_NODE_31083_length_372_cov_0.974359_1_plen_36_part_10
MVVAGEHGTESHNGTENKSVELERFCDFWVVEATSC